jgi:hypothetical protein
VSTDAREAEMSDTENAETGKETLRRVLVPLNPKHNIRYRVLALVILLPGELVLLCVLFFIIFPISNIIADIVGSFIGELPRLPHFKYRYLLEMFCIAFWFFIPHFVANMILTIKKKTDIFFEMLIALVAWSFYNFYMGTFHKTLLSLDFAFIYLFLILWLFIAEVIFYRVMFKRERAKTERRSDE